MASRPIDITVNTDRFKKDLRQLMRGKYPKTTALAFGAIAKKGRDDIRNETKHGFKLHSNYITSGIKSTPSNKSQVMKAANAMKSHGDLEAAVFVRGSNSAKRSLDFMVDHETGATRTPAAGGRAIAVPGRALRRRKYRNARGGVKGSLRPKKLLAEYSRKGPNTKGHDIPQQTKDTTGNYFIMKRGASVMIAKRDNTKRKPLGFYYFLKKSTRIKKTWGFTTTVISSVNRNYKPILERYYKRMIR